MDRRGAGGNLTVHSFNVLDVLTRSGSARDEFRALVGDDVEVDARLVSDLLRASGRVGQTLETRRALVELCALVRAVDASEAGAIDLEELRRGLGMHAARTDRFADFHEARVLLRTLEEVLGAGRAVAADDRPVRAQIAWLHRDLRGWLLHQLTGDPRGTFGLPGDAAVANLPDVRTPWRVQDDGDHRRADAIVQDLLHGADHHPVTGLLGAAWIRGWSAVPVRGDLLGDDPAELVRLGAAIAATAEPTIVQVGRDRDPRWSVSGGTVLVGDGLRPAWVVPATRDGLAVVGAERRGSTIVTTWNEAFAYTEGDGHHLVMGPRSFVQEVVGVTPLEAIAAFRDHVESLAVDDEPPPSDLLEVATMCGRLRRRSR